MLVTLNHISVAGSDLQEREEPAFPDPNLRGRPDLENHFSSSLRDSVWLKTKAGDRVFFDPLLQVVNTRRIICAQGYIEIVDIR